MESQPKSNQSNQKKYTTIISSILHWILILLLLTILSWFLLLIWFGIQYSYQESFIVTEKMHELMQLNNGIISTYYISAFYHFILSMKGIEYLANHHLYLLIQWIIKVLNNIHYKMHVSSEVMSQMIINVLFVPAEIVMGRLCIFVINLPFLISVLLIALIDGLGQRDIRKYQGARESAFFFHRIKPMTGKLFFLGFLVYMSWPWVISPLSFLIPITLIFSGMVIYLVKNFKKYA